MTRATEAIYLPLIFLTVVLLGGLRMSERVVLVPPSLFALVLGMLLFGVLVRGRVFAPDRLLNGSRSALENMNGLSVILATYFASTQILNMMIPESGLPFLLFNVFLFVLLLNTLAGATDRISVLRSLAVVLGSAFTLKFVVLSALSESDGGALKRVVLALLEGATLGTLTQPPLHPAIGYVAFATLVLFLAGIAFLPVPGRTTALVKFE
jgi:hypothetical protein